MNIEVHAVIFILMIIYIYNHRLLRSSFSGAGYIESNGFSSATICLNPVISLVSRLKPFDCHAPRPPRPWSDPWIASIVCSSWGLL